MREPPPDYGIIYNWDGAPLHYSEYPQSVEQFVQKNFAPVEDTQVGVLFWCVGVDKVYSAVYRTSGADGRDVNDRIYGETPVALYATTTGEGPSFNVPVHDEVARHAANGRLESVELHIQMEHYTQRDRVEVALDGSVLSEPAVRVVAAEDDSDPSDTDESSWLVWSLEPEQADYGPHRIQVILLDHDPRIKPPLVVQQVEFVVRYIDS